jgi:hypothetical protein
LKGNGHEEESDAEKRQPGRLSAESGWKPNIPMNPIYKLWGREPALWLALFSACVMAFSNFIFALSVDEQGALNAVCAGVLGLLQAVSVSSDGIQAVILGLIKSVLALVISFGLHLSPDQQIVIMTLATAVTGFAIRQTQVAPVGPAPADTHNLSRIGLVKRDRHEIKRLSAQLA